MKQKYQIQLNRSENQIVIRENAELDKELMSLLCEERFPVPALEAARQEGFAALAAALRTKNLYPPKTYAVKIAEAVAALLADSEQDTVELLFDDLDLLSREHREALMEEAIDEDEDDEADDLLDEEFEDDYEDEEEFPKIKSSIQIADEDPDEIEDEI